jgi:anti-sigma factor RsiW
VNSCRQNEKRIAWLAAGLLDANENRDLQAHLEVCPRCRERWQELSAVARKHRVAGETLAQVAAPRQFHERLVRRLQGAEAAPVVPAPILVARAWLAPWQTAAALLLLALIALALMVWPWANSGRPAPARAVALSRAPQPQPSQADLEPTLAHYQWALDTSLDTFDALLAEQTLRAASPPVDLAVGASLEVGPGD